MLFSLQRSAAFQVTHCTVYCLLLCCSGPVSQTEIEVVQPEQRRFAAGRQSPEAQSEGTNEAEM